jgi:hypothetical protein
MHIRQKTLLPPQKHPGQTISKIGTIVITDYKPHAKDYNLVFIQSGLSKNKKRRFGLPKTAFQETKLNPD